MEFVRQQHRFMLATTRLSPCRVRRARRVSEVDPGRRVGHPRTDTGRGARALQCAYHGLRHDEPSKEGGQHVRVPKHDQVTSWGVMGHDVSHQPSRRVGARSCWGIMDMSLGRHRANVSVQDLSKRSPVKSAKMCHTLRVYYQGANDDRMAHIRKVGYVGKVHIQPEQDLVGSDRHCRWLCRCASRCQRRNRPAPRHLPPGLPVDSGAGAGSGVLA